jgi:hypothetical protein
VGWYMGAFNGGQVTGADPLVTFNFNQSVTIHSVEIWFDNTLGNGGVWGPAALNVGDTHYSGIPEDTYGPQSFTLSGLNLTGNSAGAVLSRGNQFLGYDR